MQDPVLAGISCDALRVIPAAHLYDWPLSGSQEVNDEAADGNLPTELHAEATTTNQQPKGLLRRREKGLSRKAAIGAFSFPPTSRAEGGPPAWCESRYCNYPCRSKA